MIGRSVSAEASNTLFEEGTTWSFFDHLGTEEGSFEVMQVVSTRSIFQGSQRDCVLLAITRSRRGNMMAILCEVGGM